MNQVIDLQAKREEREAAVEHCWTCGACGGQYMFVLHAGVRCVDCDNLSPWTQVLDGVDTGR